MKVSQSSRVILYTIPFPCPTCHAPPDPEPFDGLRELSLPKFVELAVP